jgi:hypothetical protein
LSIQGGETGDGSRGGASSSSSSLTSLRSLFVFLVALTESVLPIVLLPRVLFFKEDDLFTLPGDWSYFNCRLASVASCLVYNSAMNVTS